MADLTNILKRVKAGQVVGLQDNVRAFLPTCSGSAESQQILRHCSRLVYEQQDIDVQVFSGIVDIVNICCKHQQGPATVDATFHLKSMFYIILITSKRKELHQHLMQLVPSIIPYVSQCDTSKGDGQAIVKNLYQSIWNASLNHSIPPEALQLQGYALLFLLAAGTSINKVCEQALKAVANFEHVQKSSDHLDKFFPSVICGLMDNMKKNGKVNGDVVLSVFSVVVEYAKTLLRLNKCAEFSGMVGPLVSVLEQRCDQQMVMALKVGLKLMELAMAIKLGKRNEDMMMKFLQSCSVVSSMLVPNMILLLSLLCTIAMFEHQRGRDVSYSISVQLLDKLVETLLSRCNTPLTDENVKKVATVLCQQLGYYVDLQKNSKDQKAVLKQALPWVNRANSFISSNCAKKPDTIWQIYNVGVNAGNLGVLAFKGTIYNIAEKFLETSVDMLDMYYTMASDDQRKTVATSLHKKLVLWSDALRYSGCHWDAAVAAGRGLLRKHLTTTDLVNMWVKCKRDAERTGNKKLKGLTVCDVVGEARRKFQEIEGADFNKIEALKYEIESYKKQSQNTADDQLSCGRVLMEECGGGEDALEAKVFGLLVMVEVLWIQPELAGSNSEAVDLVKKAIALVQETKNNNKCNSRLAELEALANFWLYLCNLQHIQETAAEEVKESEKPSSLTVQATDLGEEEQVNDACDVRPTPTCLTLYSQEASFAPLHSALRIWEELSSKGKSLEDVATMCSCLASVGYVYQLSGFVTPTIRAWTTLVSVARENSLPAFLLRGITELLLVVPELVPKELVKEAKEAITACQASSNQDPSIVYVTLIAITALAYYYFKLGQYNEGVLYISQALESDVMEKRTVRATEAQIIVHFVASMYAGLPHWILGEDKRPSQPSISLALLACREANALVESYATSSTNDIICWRHRVAWLHLTTTVWFGNQCLMSAQPRQARAYLKQPLRIAQELALPLRTGELLELLARVDLLCDQLEDCRVKVDSLLALLIAHPTHAHEYLPKDAIATKRVATNTKSHEGKLSCQVLSEIEIDSEERMRDCSAAPDYDLKAFHGNPGLVVVGAEERIGELAHPRQPVSPSLGYREDVTLARVESCPDGQVKCVMCSTPALQQLHISTATLLALVHAHNGHHIAAQTCFRRAMEMYSDVMEKDTLLTNYLTSIISVRSKKSTSFAMFLQARLNLVYLQTMHHQAESLALEKKWDQALLVNIKALKIIRSLDSHVLHQNMHFITVVILQGQILKRTQEHQIDNAESGDEVADESSVTPNGDEKKNMYDYKTPARPQPKTSTKSAIKTGHKTLAMPSTLTKEGNYFSIYSDDEDMQETSAKPSRLPTPPPQSNKPSRVYKRQVISKRENTRTASATSRKKEMAGVEAKLGQLALDDSPTKLVLKVPNSFSVSPCPKSSRSSTGIENKGEDAHLSPASRAPGKKRTVRKAKESAVPKTLSFSDKDNSLENTSKGSDDMDFSLEDNAESVQQRPRRLKSRAPKDEAKTKPTTSRTRVKKEAEPRVTRTTSRTLRLV
ncbi:uncharacterized protein LOC122266502 isoform X2 [Penaeus japonicus]|nr:uncharacterized protein LOC122266502 isoform X2 [Penaeus japonicus]XP_042892240.1 uncharacterized protein LOC122266502 isoform X2 [Penaeus japonicus]